MTRSSHWVIACAGLVSVPANAADPIPPWSVAMRETLDVWDVPTGLDPGLAILNKIQLSGTVSGDSFGLPGWSAHAQILRFDGRSLSNRLGDIQTADNLEAVPVTRLFEAWLAHQWGEENRSIALRAGLIDLNSQFDSTDPASLFINSSHGIGPDISRSGLNGPSIYPVSALGATLTAVPSARWTFRLGLFDGIAGEPTRPRAFVAERLGPGDGLLAIGQIDYQLGQGSRIEGGAWHYTARVAGPRGDRASDQGAYLSVEAPIGLAPRLMGWVRTGFANGDAQAVAGYVGAGLVQTGTFDGRPDDRLGIAVAHAIIGDPAVDALGLSHAETSIELTYQAKLSERIAIQPDVQYIIHPAGPAAPNALGLGLRLSLSTGFPKKPAATDPTDPTVPPDGAPTTAPADAQPDAAAVPGTSTAPAAANAKPDATPKPETTPKPPK